MIGEHLKNLARGNVVAAQPVSEDDRQVLPLCEFSLAFGGGGGSGEHLETDDPSGSSGKGIGGGVGGSAKATPVAVIIADGDDISIKTFGR